MYVTAIMRADQAYDELMRRVREETLLTTVEALLEWDEETYMPSGGVENRSEQLALVAGLLHERGTDPRLGDLLAAVEGSDLPRRPRRAGQGVLIAPPMPQERFLDLLRQRANAARPQPRSDAPDPGPTAPMRAEAIGRVA